ncbi:MAG: thioesterase [Clostridium sp.]|uniref:acyl-[acyl-carrier-protein] thioesterase n=1 Tax=Clostridium sp. TaxID=1506 RepID=UPI0025C22DD8|nr:acyl-ACP thioesterase domain-containing protein [Clostridium sp.]MCH3965557.1 thioesterase [Clostridium sp.]MCI1716885.1 thioesterase [Clostridium sp.]MCI1801185.1 thioesterase [Clostridium sp.]MCI1815071.1 thioesterase [Clostridium sp.]MCI1871974.1 thioesterase [Clostridium sp.]
MNTTYKEKEFQVNYYEIDFKKRLLITSIMNYFDDVATEQSQNMGGGLDYMEQHRVAWVIYKWDIYVNRYPSFREKLKVRTYARSFLKFYGYRTFEIIDKNQDIVCRANSVWLLIDIDKRRVKRISSDMYSIYGLTKEDNEPLVIDNVNLPDKFDFEKYFDVRYSDIDTNRHVNNVKYVDWAIETVPLDIVENYSIKNINISYKKEATYGGKIKSSTKIEEQNGKYLGLHKISDNDGNELCIVQTLWVK